MLAAKAARAAKVKRMWKSALEACAGPAAAVILDHTNSIYIIRKAEEETDVSRETLYQGIFLLLYIGRHFWK